MLRRALLVLSTILFALPALAIEVRVSANALERTLRNQLFNVPGAPGQPGRFYLRGTAATPCSVYAEDPHVSFAADRIVVSLRTHSRLGTPLHGACLGVALAADAEVSFIPESEGDAVGFRDARIEHLSGNKELNFLLVPFLSRKLPAEMKVNASDLMRKLLARSAETTGYALALDSLKIHSMLVQTDALIIDLDANLRLD